eukprot:TRINITY_DN5194_c0_g1_i1.p1 TRINITY_DN5194_c0_g1~~TRINITY_DN5194_c0_g1_i1.p1  ORF type:complete len:440 (+),score=123.98 TRINITY_DN5194_c0_g1_i1:1097-2416(+)
MSTATFIENTVLDFQGNVSPSAMSFGDIDNDGENEFVLGNSGGDLGIFKGGSSAKPWKKCKNLGHICGVTNGPLLNNGLNVLLATSMDGWCYVFSFFDLFPSEENLQSESLEELEEEEDNNNSESDESTTLSHSLDSYRLKTADDPDVLKYALKQRIPANVKDIILDDVDGDGRVELLLLLTDRVIRTYRWEFTENLKSKGRLLSLNKWDFAGQIGSVALHKPLGRPPLILVTQPGGSCIKISCGEESEKVLKEYAAESRDSLRNLNVSSEIIGNFGSHYALATLDGSVIIMDEGKIIKKIKLDHQLFCLNRLALSPNGKEELIVSSWDGHTYIISQDYRILEFHFGESIAAFKTGTYSINGRSVSAFVFATFTDKVYLYHDIDLSKGIGLKSIMDQGAAEVATMKDTLKDRSALDFRDPSEALKLLAYAPLNCLKGTL